jgi:hypothetical protein
VFAFGSHYRDSSGPFAQAQRPRRSGPVLAVQVLAFIIVTLLLLLLLFLRSPSAPLLTRSEAVSIPVPRNCALTRNAAPDEMQKYLERERFARKLIFKEWITCPDVPVAGFTFADDRRWLPSYAPGAFQFRRTVVIVPYARPIPQGSAVVAEVCVMPWHKYLRQIVWEYNGKFALWN